MCTWYENGFEGFQYKCHRMEWSRSRFLQRREICVGNIEDLLTQEIRSLQDQYLAQEIRFLQKQYRLSLFWFARGSQKRWQPFRFLTQDAPRLAPGAHMKNTPVGGIFHMCSRQESNLYYRLRKLASYPLNDGSYLLYFYNTASIPLKP